MNETVSSVYATVGLQLVPPNLAVLGVKRATRKPDLETIYRTPYPVLGRYKLLCNDFGLSIFAGGTYKNQGPSSVPGYCTSGYRDEIIEGRESSPHLFALALDVAVGDVSRQLEAGLFATKLFSRVGLYPDNGFIHIDLVPDSWIMKYRKRRFWVRISGEYTSFDSYISMADYVSKTYGVEWRSDS